MMPSSLKSIKTFSLLPSLFSSRSQASVTPFLFKSASLALGYFFEIPLFLFWGGRTRESLGLYEKYINGAISKKYLSHFQKALSQEDKKEYVQDVLIKNKNQVCETIKNYGVIMICGSLSMQHDVLDVLEQISTKNLNQPLSDFENNGQLLLDCY